MYIHVPILLHTPLSARLPLDAEQSSLCYTVGPCWLSILNIAVCTSPSQTPYLFLYPSPYSLCSAAAAAKSLQSCPTLCDPIDVWQPTRLPCPWDSPGKNTGMGCHFLLQCMKVKSESEVAQSCSTLRDPMDCSPPGSSIHGIFQARVLEWGAIAFSIPHSV